MGVSANLMMRNSVSVREVVDFLNEEFGKVKATPFKDATAQAVQFNWHDKEMQDAEKKRNVSILG